MSLIGKEIGKKIRDFRKMRGLTLEQLAGRVDKTASALSKCENGAVTLDVDSLYALAQALDVQVEQLLCREKLLRFSAVDRVFTAISTTAARVR